LLGRFARCADQEDPPKLRLILTVALGKSRFRSMILRAHRGVLLAGGPRERLRRGSLRVLFAHARMAVKRLLPCGFGEREPDPIGSGKERFR